jgi:Recombination directionality factor-like
MPIKGLTQVRRLPRLGKIKMGVKVKSEKGVEHPQKTDYFVCPPDVQASYGQKPKVLDILIPVEDEDKWAPQYYKLYSRTQGLVCKGDGCNASRLIDTATGDRAHKTTTQAIRKDWECAGRKCPDYISKEGCKEVMSLMFILYKVPGMGVWQIDTSSVNSIININSCADYIRAVFGKTSWIPLQLTIEPKEVQNPESGKRQTVYVLNLRNNMVLLDMVETTKKFQAQLPDHKRLLLPAADDTEVQVEELAEDGQEPGDKIEEPPEPAVEKNTGNTTAEQKEEINEPTSDEIFESCGTAPRIKVNADEIGIMIHDLRKKKMEEVSRHGLTQRFLQTYHVQQAALDRCKNYQDMLDILADAHLKDFIDWLNELTKKYV